MCYFCFFPARVCCFASRDVYLSRLSTTHASVTKGVSEAADNARLWCAFSESSARSYFSTNYTHLAVVVGVCSSTSRVFFCVLQNHILHVLGLLVLLWYDCCDFFSFHQVFPEGYLCAVCTFGVGLSSTRMIDL